MKDVMRRAALNLMDETVAKYKAELEQHPEIDSFNDIVLKPRMLYCRVAGEKVELLEEVNSAFIEEMLYNSDDRRRDCGKASMMETNQQYIKEDPRVVFFLVHEGYSKSDITQEEYEEYREANGATSIRSMPGSTSTIQVIQYSALGTRVYTQPMDPQGNRLATCRDMGHGDTDAIEFHGAMVLQPLAGSERFH